uniref:Uncharacterized protein n=1 Tax=Pristionchus pacificus TaxID=54126 RepID=A0A8R1YM33_PRIPA
MPPLIAPILQFFLTIYYFFYFLAKGKPEWKCPNEKHGGDSWNVKKVCCDGDVTFPITSSTEKGIYGKINGIASMIRQYSIQFVHWIKRIPHSIARNSERLGSIMKRMSASIVSLCGSAWQIISTFFSTLFSFILFRRAPSKSMPTSEVIYSSQQEKNMNIHSLSLPSTPVPYSSSSSILSSPPPPLPSSPPPPFPSSSPPSYPPPPPPPPPPSRSTRVPSSHKEEVNDNEICMMKKEEETPSKGGAFYTTRVFESNQKNGGSKNKDLYVNEEVIKGGIPVFPPSIMAEIAGSRGGASNQVNRSEINRTPIRTVKERLRDASLTPTHTSTFEYPNEISHARSNVMELTKNNWRVDAPKGWEKSYGDREIRSKSVGPPRVSRMEDSLNNEAQFIFRAHGSDEDGRDNYSMGRREWNSTNMMERMEDKMNKQMDWRATTPSIWSCNTSRISSPSFNTRDDEYGVRKRGRVGESARRWPPPTNAQGAEIGKDVFVDGDGIITTASTRIVQKKNEESWRWLDDNGRVIDEHKEFYLMGDTDQVKRDGPYQVNQYSQHYFVDRNGTIKFENTHRQVSAKTTDRIYVRVYTLFTFNFLSYLSLICDKLHIQFDTFILLTQMKYSVSALQQPVCGSFEQLLWKFRTTWFSYYILKKRSVLIYLQAPFLYCPKNLLYTHEWKKNRIHL